MNELKRVKVLELTLNGGLSNSVASASLGVAIRQL